MLCCYPEMDKAHPVMVTAMAKVAASLTRAANMLSLAPTVSGLGWGW
jgi:hypothetical protein